MEERKPERDRDRRTPKCVCAVCGVVFGVCGCGVWNVYVSVCVGYGQETGEVTIEM